jgi:hypothetical protein
VLRRSLVFIIGSALLASACAGTSEVTKVGGLPRSTPAAGKKRAIAKVGPLRAHRFAEATDVVGPYVGRDGQESLAAWAEAADGGRAIFSTPIDARGAPGKPVRIGNVGPELDLVLVRGFGRASGSTPGKPRFALVTTRKLEAKTRIEVTALGADGSAAWGPTNVADRGARVLWVGFAVSGEKPLVLWAEQATQAKAGEPAALYALPIALANGQPQPVLLAQKACVWQTASSANAAALAIVKPTGNGCSGGTVTLDLLDAHGKSSKSVDLGGRSGLDLDLIGTDAGFVLAWSDRGELEPRAFTAVVDAQGGVRSEPAAAVPAMGEQAVVALVAGASASAAAFLVWESPAERAESARSFQISALDATGRATGTRARLLYARGDGGAPELAAYRGGVAALTLAPACAAEDACDSASVPTFVALDSALQVSTSEPLLLDALHGRAADLGWGLTCQDSGCFALAAPSRSPAPLFTVPLPLRTNSFRAAAEQIPIESKPRVVASDVIARADAPLAAIAAQEVSGRQLVGYLTDFDPTTPWQKLTKPAEDGRFEPLRARIGLRSFASEAGRAAPPESHVISLRAHSLGGLSLLREGANAKEAVALWTGLDKGEPQVFLTQLGADGKRGQQRMLTRKNGDVSDVTGIALDGGYLVAWVDERSGDSEVYATRVGRTLDKAGPEQRITSTDGAASELTLTRVGGKPYAVWSDARAAEEPGWADIYGAFLRPTDAARDGNEHRLTSTRPHSFAPQLADMAGTTVLAWLEEAADDAPASVRVATLTTSGQLSGDVTVVPLEAGAPRGLGLACGDVSCRLVASVETEGQGALFGFEWRPAMTSRAKRLLGLGSAVATAVSPILRGNTVYVADARDGHGLVRRLTIDW